MEKYVQMTNGGSSGQTTYFQKFKRSTLQSCGVSVKVDIETIPGNYIQQTPPPQGQEIFLFEKHNLLSLTFFGTRNFPVPGFLCSEFLREFSFLYQRVGSLSFHVQEMSA